MLLQFEATGEGKTYREIAEIVDCSVSTVHKYLAKLN
mgnify:CR=1 FL=1